MHRILAFVISGLLLTFSLGCRAKHIRTYSGTELTPGQVATLRTNSISVTRIDGKPIEEWGSKTDWFTDAYRVTQNRVIEVQPGRHRLTVEYHEIVGQTIRTGINAFTITYPFAAGTTYSFQVSQQSLGDRATWQPQLIDFKTHAVLAQADKFPDPPAKSKPGTSTILGLAGIGDHSATGREIALIKRNAATDAWVTARRTGKKISTPAERKSPVAVTVGYGLGFFEFTNVLPGDYYAIFEARFVGFAAAPVTVRLNDRSIDRIQVARSQ